VAVLTANPALADRPADGICDCGPYAEGPALCRPLAGPKRAACIASNLKWLDQCAKWRSETCHAPLPAAAPLPPAAPAPAAGPAPAALVPAVQAPAAAPAPVAPAPVALPPALPSSPLAKFGGKWVGEGRCRSEKWRLTLMVGLLADGSLMTDAEASLAFGSFDKIDIDGNTITMRFKTLMTETIYTGHLVAPNRIEGTVRVAGNDCRWFVAH